jgi:hypothetical protein
MLAIHVSLVNMSVCHSPSESRIGLQRGRLGANLLLTLCSVSWKLRFRVEPDPSGHYSRFTRGSNRGAEKKGSR